MTKDELAKWLKESKFVDGDSEYDENGNCEAWRVYERDGKLYRVEFLNGSPYEKWGDKGFIRDIYEPREVIRETEMVEIVRYREIDEPSDEIRPM